MRWLDEIGRCNLLDMNSKHRTKHFTALTALLLVAAGCRSGSDGSTPPESPSMPTQALRLYALKCGNVTINDLSLLTPGTNEGVERTLTNTCFLIDHPRGRLLWDTGLNDELGPDPVTVFDGAFELSVTDPLLPQLAAIGADPSNIDFLALSHFHDDHTGNANVFSGSRLLIQQAELDAAFGAQPERYGFDPATYQALDPGEAMVLHQEHDVFGDGRVRIVPAPGHSPGHQVLFVDLENTGVIALSGDLYHFAGAREMQTIPSFNADPEASRASMVAVEAMIEQTGATLWIQHDLEQMSALRHAPAYYD